MSGSRPRKSIFEQLKEITLAQIAAIAVSVVLVAAGAVWAFCKLYLDDLREQIFEHQMQVYLEFAPKKIQNRQFVAEKVNPTLVVLTGCVSENEIRAGVKTTPPSPPAMTGEHHWDFEKLVQFGNDAVFYKPPSVSLAWVGYQNNGLPTRPLDFQLYTIPEQLQTNSFKMHVRFIWYGDEPAPGLDQVPPDTAFLLNGGGTMLEWTAIGFGHWRTVGDHAKLISSACFNN